MKIHEKYMQRCLQIAKNGLGTTAPNPSVGCVIVYDDKIIGEGFTSPFGGNHAEVNAIESVKDKSVLSNSHLYVTLEPCSHHGKTPPCTDMIIENRIQNVYIGARDSNTLVNGKGINALKKAGCQVETSILEIACRQHHKRFFTSHERKRPYVILKWAESSDGFIAPKAKEAQAPFWISNSQSQRLVHKWRGVEQAILVGTNTVLADNPSLTTRHLSGKNPIRIVLDRTLKLDHELNVFNSEAETIIISSAQAVAAIENPDFRQFKTIDWEKHTSIAQQICDVLYKKSINSVIVEGGLQTLTTFIDEDLWDEARVFVGSNIIGDGIKSPKLIKQPISEEIILDNRLLTYNNN